MRIPGNVSPEVSAQQATKIAQRLRQAGQAQVILADGPQGYERALLPQESHQQDLLAASEPESIDHHEHREPGAVEHHSHRRAEAGGLGLGPADPDRDELEQEPDCQL